MNARDAMPGGGTLTIEIADVELAEAGEPALAGPSGPMTSMVVTDTGVGMDADTLSHLFEPFFTTKGPGKGTGLGLATVYGIVLQSGGTIEVTSHPGDGSTFTILLPRVERAAVAGETAAPEKATRGGRTGTILVVEDDDGVRSFASRVLKKAGYQVLTAPDGATAINAAQNGPVELVLADVVMPGMSGGAVASKLAETQPGLRVLYMSGHADKGIGQHDVMEPGVDFLAKPFTADGLLDAVESAIARTPVDGASADTP